MRQFSTGNQMTPKFTTCKLQTHTHKKILLSNYILLKLSIIFYYSSLGITYELLTITSN